MPTRDDIDPLIMNVDRTQMSDGRYLIYYSFEQGSPPELSRESDEPDSLTDRPSDE